MKRDPIVTEAMECERLGAMLRPFLAGQDPTIASAVIADLMAMLIAGHHPSLRAELSNRMFELVHSLVSINIELMIDGGLVGPEWRGKDGLQ